MGHRRHLGDSAPDVDPSGAHREVSGRPLSGAFLLSGMLACFV